MATAKRVCPGSHPVNTLATATHTRAQTTSNWDHQTRVYQSHTIAMSTHLGIKHIQLPQPRTRAPTTYNCHRQTRGYQSYPIAITTHLGTTITHPAATPHTWAPSTYNCHLQTLGTNHIHPVAMTTHLGIQSHPTAPHTLVHTAATATRGHNHIQLPPSNSWVPIISNCHDHTLGHPITPSCHSHTRGHQPHPTGTTKLVGTNHIQLPCQHTWAPNHITAATATHAGTNHIQLAPPNFQWVPITSIQLP